MAAEVTIGGKKFPKWGIYASVIGGIGVLGYALYAKHKSGTSSTSSTSTSTGIDPVTGMDYSQDNQVDPATGMTYLSEAQEYGSVQAAESGFASGGYGGYSSYGMGSYDTGSLQYVPNTSTGENYATNAQWAQAVEAGLSDIGYSQTDVAAALGRYLSNLSLTSDQASIIEAGIAEYGNPPSGSFQIHLAPAPAPNPKTFPPITQVEVPNVVGVDLVTAQQDIGYAGLKSSASGPPTTVRGEVREVTAQKPVAGHKVNKGTNVHLTYKIENPPKRK